MRSLVFIRAALPIVGLACIAASFALAGEIQYSGLPFIALITFPFYLIGSFVAHLAINRIKED
jgi:hypothetical protein